MNRITAVTGILAGAALALVGCSSSTPEPIEVTGTQSACVGNETVDGFTANCLLEVSDARVSGKIDVDFTKVGDGPPVAFEGTAVITNDDGTWAGDCTGTVDEETDFNSFDCSYVGAGDYDGMTYESHVEGVEYPSDVTGTLTEG